MKNRTVHDLIVILGPTAARNTFGAPKSVSVGVKNGVIRVCV